MKKMFMPMEEKVESFIAPKKSKKVKAAKMPKMPKIKPLVKPKKVSKRMK